MTLKLVSLGSSYASGPGIPPVVDKAARRSGSNYAHVLASRLGASLTDLSVSAATLDNITHDAQVSRGKTFPPQIEGVPVDADIIMLLGGGNDMGYVLPLFIECFTAHLSTRLLWRLASFFKKTPKPQSLDEHAVTERYERTLDAIHDRAPNAHIIVVEYLTVLSNGVNETGLPLRPERLDHYRDIAAALQRATANAADQPLRKDWCTRVHVAKASEAHGLGTSQPWMRGFSRRLFCKIGGGVLHPNKEGMAAVADLISEHVHNLPDAAVKQKLHDSGA
ncbi:hypothetical protein JDV02_004061 [Purpureocillium takamizusanense]|uniref:SGNH hydrolase-type esterase domain-containing protein n=1 Tax=Purpureocillium takamizusanense TaxID=2060973 RepID=A0A9Q8QBR5_9HYPO|nr:uncharacterized protein JDV02_004061 [Purpureocillium takamizusanense]UNI17739.1 hypothetical protein JDV02_004061 [Purpureocillium takamizusanense]